MENEEQDIEREPDLPLILRKDVESLRDHDKVILYPAPVNKLHFKPTRATFYDNAFYAYGTDPFDGPDYTTDDVLEMNFGFRMDTGK